MYVNDTILTLKEQRDADPETGEAFPYNRVRVIGPSPVSHADKGDWKGADAAGVIIVALTNFGATLDEPFGKLREMYDVEEIPETVPARQPEAFIRPQQAPPGRTPEEVFAAEAPGVPPEEGQIRGRTSPLGAPGGPKEHDGPLGKAPSRRKTKKDGE
jgi:hypothetical protein